MRESLDRASQGRDLLRATLTRSRSWATGVTAQRALIVLGTLALLELAVFWSYFTGDVSPAPDDFIGSYNNEPLAWWRDLELGDAPDWVPYAWGGYPAAVSIQNGSWYIPLGLAALVSPYSIHAAAVLQALHVGFGALGMYVLGRNQKLSFSASVFGLVAYFFAVGFYGNALHSDIVRGFAWVPWVLLCLTPRFPWRRWWSVPVVALILWQMLVSSYPGLIVALGYCAVVLVAVYQLGLRPRLTHYLLPLAASGIAALLLSAPKYFAGIALRGGLGVEATAPDESVFSRSMLGTVFFSYDLPELPNDLSMRSFFVVAPCLVLAALSWRHARSAAPALTLVGTAVVLGMPFLPWYEQLAALPGMSLSRFRMSDFRAPLVAGLVLLAMIVLSREVEARGGHGSAARRALTVVTLAAVPVAAFAASFTADYQVSQWVTPWMVVVASSMVVGALVLGPAPGPPGRSQVAVAIIAIAAVSGVNWAFSVTPPWRFPRAEVEMSTWQAESDELIGLYEADDGLVQRPARTPLDDAVAPATDVYWNSAFYTGDDAVGGYVNLKGSSAFRAALNAVTEPSTYFAARSILAAPGTGIAVTGPTALPDPDDVESCVTTTECGPGLTVRPDGYEVGRLTYVLSAEAPRTVLFNESYYPGWHATACGGEGSCRELDVTQGGAGLVLVEVPAGSWDLVLEYETPGKTRDHVAFAAGAALILGVGLLSQRRSPGSRRTRPAAPAPRT